MAYIGFNIDNETIEKLKVITFITKKNRTELIKEGLNEIIKKHDKSFDDFQQYVKTFKK